MFNKRIFTVVRGNTNDEFRITIFEFWRLNLTVSVQLIRNSKFVIRNFTPMEFTRFTKQNRTEIERNKKFLLSLKKKNPRNVDDAFHALHEEVFEEIDCLQCANCCKTTSPIFYDADIDRLAKSLRIKSVDFVTQYLKIDDDGDQVLKSSPCPFLGSDNYCAVYEARPKACREYPHTDRKKMVQIMELTHKNTQVCPAVFEIVERLKKVI